MKTCHHASNLFALTAITGLVAFGACGSDAPAPTLDASPDTTPDTASDTTPDDTTPDTTPDTTSPGFKLPPLANWLLLTPNAGFSELAVQPTLAWDDAGHLAVAWTGRADQRTGIFGARFAMALPPVATTPPFLLNTDERGLRNEPRICHSGASDGFVVAWSADLQTSSDDNLAVFHRRFGPDFNPLPSASPTPENDLETDRSGNHWLATLACQPGFGYVVGGVRANATATGFETFFTRFDLSGTALGAAIDARPDAVAAHFAPAVAMTPDGTVHIVWEDSTGTTQDSETTVFYRDFPANGPAGPPVDLGLRFGRPSRAPAIAAAPDGTIIVFAQASTRFFAALRAPDGTFTDVALPTTDTANTGAPAAAAIGPSRFMVAWLRAAPNNQQDIRAAEVSAEGTATPETLATGRYPAAYRPAIAARAGRLAIAWTEALGNGAFSVRVALASTPP